MEGETAVPTPRGEWLKRLIQFNSESDDRIRAALKALISSPTPKLPETALRNGLIVPGSDVDSYFKQHAIANEPFLSRLRDSLVGAICELDRSEFLRGNVHRMNVVYEPWPLWQWNGRQMKGCFRLADLESKSNFTHRPKLNWYLTRIGFALAQSYPGHPFCEDAMRHLPQFGGLLPGQLAPWDVDFLRQIVGATAVFLARAEQLTAADSPQSSTLTENECTQNDGDGAGKLRRDWCHPAGTPNPRDFPHGPLTGNQTGLSEAYFGDGPGDRRRLQSLARDGAVWFRGRGHRLEMFFRDYIVFERCRNQMPKDRKSSKKRQKRTQDHEKFTRSYAKQRR